MTVTENAKLQQQRQTLAETVAGQLLAGLPDHWQNKMESKVIELLLSAKEGFEVAAATAFVAEKCDEWASLPSQKRYTHLRSRPLEADQPA